MSEPKYPYTNSNMDITLTCDNCGQTALMVNRGTPKQGHYQMPIHWITVGEMVAERKHDETVYCSRACAATAFSNAGGRKEEAA